MLVEPRGGLLRRLVGHALEAVAQPVASVSTDVVAGAKAMGRTALDITIFVVIGIVGYVFALLGAAWLLADAIGMPASLLVLGGVHLVVGIIGVVVQARRDRAREAAERDAALAA